MGITEWGSALAVVEAVSQNITDGCQDMIVAIQREQELFRIKERAGGVVAIPVIFGNPHLEPPATENHPVFIGKSDSMQMRGHDGICPEFHSASIALQRQNIGDIPDILVIAEQNFLVAGYTKMIQPFHTGKLINSHNNPGVKSGVRTEKIRIQYCFGFCNFVSKLPIPLTTTCYMCF